MNNLEKRVNNIKKKYQFQLNDKCFEGLIFPLEMFIDENRLFVIDSVIPNSKIVVFDLSTKKEVERICFDKPIRYINYCKNGKSIYYVTNLGKDVFVYNLESKQSIKLELTPHNHNLIKSIYSMKIFENELYILDIFSHLLNIYDLEGDLKKTICLEQKFSFPLQFNKLSNSDKILISRSNRLNSGYSYKKLSGTKFPSNIAIYDINKDKIEYLPEIDLLLKDQLVYQMISDDDGYMYINSFNVLIKLDADLNVIFITEIGNGNAITFNTPNLPFQFYSTAIKGNNLYISEKNCIKKVLHFSI